MKRGSYIFLLVLFSGYAYSKIITNTSIWNINTHIYHINTQVPGQIQIIEFKPDGIALEVVKTINLTLARDVTSIQDVNIIFGEVPILLMLTETGQLLGINLETKNNSFALQLNDYFGVTDHFFGSLTVKYDQDGTTYLAIVVNSKLIGILWVALPANFYLFSHFIANHLQINLATGYASRIDPRIKIALARENNRIFSKIETLTGNSVWELNLKNTKLSRFYDLGTSAIQGFILLDLQQQQNIDAIAIYGSKFLQINSIADFSSKLRLFEHEGEDNIKNIIIGPAVTESLLSYYLVIQNGTNYFLKSNNFTDLIRSPANKQLFLRHGELVLPSLEEDKLFTIHCKTGVLRELTIIKQRYLAIDGVLSADEDFLFWDPEFKQHILLISGLNNIHLKSFALGFDKPKILSWHQEIIDDL